MHFLKTTQKNPGLNAWVKESKSDQVDDEAGCGGCLEVATIPVPPTTALASLLRDPNLPAELWGLA